MNKEEKLIAMADKILKENGSSSLVNFRDINDQQYFTPYGKDGERLRGLPKIRGVEPSGDVRVAKSIGPVCPSCGKPKSKYSDTANSVCRACFSKKAIKRHEKAILEYWDKRDEHYQKYSCIAEMVCVEWGHEREQYGNLDIAARTRIEPDFSPALLDEIAEAESALGMPIAFWPSRLVVTVK